jgi:hypothetical protein
MSIRRNRVGMMGLRDGVGVPIDYAEIAVRHRL